MVDSPHADLFKTTANETLLIDSSASLPKSNWMHTWTLLPSLPLNNPTLLASHPASYVRVWDNKWTERYRCHPHNHLHLCPTMALGQIPNHLSWHFNRSDQTSAGSCIMHRPWSQLPSLVQAIRGVLATRGNLGSVLQWIILSTCLWKPARASRRHPIDEGKGSI